MKLEPKDIKFFERLDQDPHSKDYFRRLVDWLCDARNEETAGLDREQIKAMAKFLEKEVILRIGPDRSTSTRGSEYI